MESPVTTIKLHEGFYNKNSVKEILPTLPNAFNASVSYKKPYSILEVSLDDPKKETQIWQLLTELLIEE